MTRKSKKKKPAPEPVTMVINVNVTTMSDNELLDRVQEAIKRKKHNEAGLKQIESTLRDLAFADILKLTELELVIPSFILCSCFIEQISIFRFGCTEITNSEFLQFVKEYLPAYDGESLRKDLRNRVVHNYSLGETYILTNKNPQGHLGKFKSPSEDILKIVIDLESFVADLGKALDKFCIQLKTDPQIRGNALDALSKIYIIGKGEFELNHTKGSYLEFPINSSPEL